MEERFSPEVYGNDAQYSTGPVRGKGVKCPPFFFVENVENVENVGNCFSDAVVT